MAERRVPRIRFKGFEEDWEQRKLGELAFITTGKLDANAAKRDGEYNFFTCGKEILKTNSYAFDGEAILINGNGDLGYTRKYVGKFNAYQRTYVLQGFVMDYEYIEHAIHKFLPDKIKYESIGGAMPYIKIDSLMNLELTIPVVQEAVVVTRFLNELDSLLSLHQRKLEKLKILKKAMLEKMFPKNGEKVPEIRFSGFADDWEQRKLGEVVNEITRTDENSDAPVMMITASDGFINQSERYSTDNAGQSLRRYILLERGELAYNHGASKLRPYGSCFALTTEEKARVPFVYHCFSTEREEPELLSLVLNGKSVELQLRKIVSSGARMDGLLNISFEEYSSIPINLPIKLEQTKIVDFFRSLDKVISLHQRKLEKLRQIKKSMLERMFV